MELSFTSSASNDGQTIHCDVHISVGGVGFALTSEQQIALLSALGQAAQKGVHEQLTKALPTLPLSQES